jgi:hypothetical protein
MTLTTDDLLEKIHDVDKRVVALETTSKTTEDISDDSTTNNQYKIALIGMGSGLILTIIYVIVLLHL